MDDQNESAEPEAEMEAEEYQHVKEPKNSDKTTLDNATEEQSKQIQHQDDEESKETDEAEENPDSNALADDNSEEVAEDLKELQQLEAEKIEKKKDVPSKTEKANDRTDVQEEMEIEGEIIPTMNVPRSEDTTAYFK